jgi:hypothetical protein
MAVDTEMSLHWTKEILASREATFLRPWGGESWPHRGLRRPIEP